MKPRVVLFSLLTAVSLTLSAQDQILIRPGLKIPQLQLKAVSKERPQSLDNSYSPYFPPILYQYGGSCAQASGIHYLFSYEMNRVLERPVNNSSKNYFSYRYTWHFLNGGHDEGSLVSDGIEIAMKQGLVTAANYGSSQSESYYRWPSGYNKYYDAMHYRVRTMNEVVLSDQAGINTLIDYMVDKQDGHPGGGIASFSIDEWGYTTYNGPSELGYKTILTLNGNTGPHAMTLVGYDLSVEYDCNGDGEIQDSERGAFVLVNSWDTWWGSNGRAYIPFHYFTAPVSDGGLPSYYKDALCIEAEYREPLITVSAKITYSSRNDLAISIGSADGAQAEHQTAKTSVLPPIFRGQGGDNYMQGLPFEASKTIEIGIDYSEKASVLDTMKAPCFFLNVSRTVMGKAGNGYVKSVSVHDYRSGKEVVYTKDFTNQEGALNKLGTHRFKVPTKPWVKRRETWLEQTTTSACPVEFVYKADDSAPTYSIRTANGSDYASMKLVGYDEKSGKVKLKFEYYDE